MSSAEITGDAYRRDRTPGTATANGQPMAVETVPKDERELADVLFTLQCVPWHGGTFIERYQLDVVIKNLKAQLEAVRKARKR